MATPASPGPARASGRCGYLAGLVEPAQALALLAEEHHIAGKAGTPFSPMVVWGTGHDRLGIGLGDLLLATVFPLVMRKAFGRDAGLVALASALGTLGVLLMGTLGALLTPCGVPAALSAMTPLGPLMVLQYVYWVHWRGPERTSREYLQAEPVRSVAPVP